MYASLLVDQELALRTSVSRYSRRAPSGFLSLQFIDTYKLNINTSSDLNWGFN